MTPVDVRAKLEPLMDNTVADEDAHHDWTYEEVRPLPVPTKTRRWRKGTKVRGDCALGVRFLCWWVPPCPDPMGRGFDEYGNSTTMCLHLVHVDSLDEIEVGDPITFGVSGDEHATMVRALIRKNGHVVDVNMWSFGHPGAPNFYLLSQDGREYQLLKLPVKDLPPTPEEVLRAKTGYWAWRQWRLGTGAWHSYGRRNKTVRPDVPRRIPAAWWRKLAHSLVKGRKRRGNSPTAKP